MAAGAGSTGLPLWLVSVIAFAAILGVGLIAILSPLAKQRRDAKQARLDEVQRYRVLGAYGEKANTVVTAPQPEGMLTARALAAMDKAVRARGKRDRLVQELERAGMRMRPEEWAVLHVAVPTALLAVGGFLIGPIGLLLGAAGGWIACRLFIRIKTSKRLAAFEVQLPDALQLISGALRTGFALNQAISAVVREGTEPVSSEFGRVLHETRLGADLEDALDELAQRMQSYDMELVVMAVRTAREVGGNLAEVLQTTVVTMRERVQLRGQVQTLTAEGRLSAKVLVCLPILMAGYLLLFKKAYLVPLYTTGIGIVLLAVGGTLLILGTVWLRRLTKIEV